jgi:hypothetical protein
MKKRIEPLLLYWILITISVFLMSIFGCSKVNAEESFQYEQTKVRRTVVGRLKTSKIVYIALNNRDVLYIEARYSGSKEWFIVFNTGKEYPDRTNPYCIIYWKGVDTRIKFYNLYVDDYYRISVLR